MERVGVAVASEYQEGAAFDYAKLSGYEHCFSLGLFVCLENACIIGQAAGFVRDNLELNAVYEFAGLTVGAAGYIENFGFYV